MDHLAHKAQLHIVEDCWLIFYDLEGEPMPLSHVLNLEVRSSLIILFKPKFLELH